jgi:two-component system, sporulation sensor kinase E
MRTEPLAAINSVALAIGRFATLDEMLEHALTKVLEVVQTDAGGIYLLDEEKAELNLVVHQGMSEAVWRDFDRLKLGEGLSGRVALDGEPIVVRNLADDPRLTRMAARTVGFRAFASVPLRSNFQTYGTRNVHARSAREFSEEEVQLLTSMASQIALAVANAKLYLRLQASERKFRGLVEDAEDVIYLTDTGGRVTYASPALERLLGWTPEGITGRAMVDIVHPDDRPHFETALERMLRGNVLRALEFRLLRCGGAGFRWFSQTNGPLRDETGTLLGMHCIAHDITDRRELQEQMVKAERLAHLGRMAANIAHEIRNPLGAIVNSIKLLRRSGAASDPHLLEIVTEEADRLDAIIREFLLFARPPARAAIACDARELLETTVELFRRDAKVPDVIAVRVSSAPPLPPICADPNQVRQVLWNLLTNAVESMSGPGAIDIEARLSSSGDALAIAVTDDGPGVSDPEVLFEPFYTTKAQGTGLGLPIVARIVRDHGGALDVENVPGRGGRFTFSLPLATERIRS